MKLSLSQKCRIGSHLLRCLLTRPLFKDYNPRSPAFFNNPYPVYRRMRDEKPIFWSPHTLGWHVSGNYESLVQLLKDDRLTHSFRAWRFAPQSKPSIKFEVQQNL